MGQLHDAAEGGFSSIRCVAMGEVVFQRVVAAYW